MTRPTPSTNGRLLGPIDDAPSRWAADPGRGGLTDPLPAAGLPRLDLEPIDLSAAAEPVARLAVRQSPPAGCKQVYRVPAVSESGE